VNNYLDCNAIAIFEALDTLAYFSHDSTEFVPECERNFLFGNGMWCGGAEIGTSKVFVEVYIDTSA